MLKLLDFVVVVTDVFSASWRVLICQKQFSLAFGAWRAFILDPACACILQMDVLWRIEDWSSLHVLKVANVQICARESLTQRREKRKRESRPDCLVALSNQTWCHRQLNMNFNRREVKKKDGHHWQGLQWERKSKKRRWSYSKVREQDNVGSAI